MSSFSTYIIGFIILVIGLALAAYLLNVPAMWIAVGVVVLIGIGVLMATSRTRIHRGRRGRRSLVSGVRSQGSGVRVVKPNGGAFAPPFAHLMSASAAKRRRAFPPLTPDS